MKRTLVKLLGGKTECNVIRNGQMFNITRLYGREVFVDAVESQGGYNLGDLDYEAKVARPKRVDIYKPHAPKKNHENLTRKGEFM